MNRTIVVSVALVVTLLLWPARSRAEEGGWSSAIARMEADIEAGKPDDAVSTGMPAYRLLASDRLGLPAIRDYAFNMATLFQARRAVVDILSRRKEASGAGRTVDGRILHRSLTSLGKPRTISSDGMTEEEVRFLGVLYAAVVQSNVNAVLRRVDEFQDSEADEFLFVYLIVTLETVEGEQLLWALPERLQSAEGVKPFVDYCAELERRDLAAEIYRTLCGRAANVAECRRLCSLCVEQYLALEDIAHAIEAWRVVVTKYPESAEAEDAQLEIIDLNVNRYKAYGTAADECRKFLSQFPTSRRRPEIQLRIASLKYQAGDYEGAIQHLETLPRDPAMAGTEGEQGLLKGICHIGKGESDLGLEVLDDFLSRNRGHILAPRAMLIIANTNISRQEYGKAEEMLKKLIQTYPRSEYTQKARDLSEALGRVGSRARSRETGPEAAGRRP
jgi:outer membrane protein assembly factor BamD (BamD/ComL family)